jgi:hypothetical protein
MVGLTQCCKCWVAIGESDYGRSVSAFQTVKSIPEAAPAATENPIDLPH